MPHRVSCPPGLRGPSRLGGRPLPYEAVTGPSASPSQKSTSLLSAVRPQGSPRPSCMTVFLKIGPLASVPLRAPISGSGPDFTTGSHNRGIDAHAGRDTMGFYQLVSLLKSKWAVSEELG